MIGDLNDYQDGSSSDGDLSMADLLEQYLPEDELRRGEVVRGTVIRVTPQEIVVDVGAKCEGTVSGRELERVEADVLDSLRPGDELSVYILSSDGAGGEVNLSIARAQQEKGWLEAEKLLENEQTIELEVASSNRGGLLVRIGGVRGFVPASQLDPARCVPRISDPECREVLSSMVGDQIELQVIEVDKDRNRLILSERAALAKVRAEEAQELFKSLEEGEIVEGRVSNLTHFGAFVDLGGVDGLLHLSEISWMPVEHPGDFFDVGQELRVMILSVDRERKQVALSTKRLEPDPWVGVEDRYESGQLVKGRVTRLAKWGAFARIVGDEAIEGLIHISELADERVSHPRDIVQSGDVVPLRIVRIEPERHRMALSLRRANSEEEQLDIGE
ncbi:MAG: S1 RNA-binding domain-containing protein [Anaerolineae bacterium]|jgi:small subunit ribosomal protein S1